MTRSVGTIESNPNHKRDNRKAGREEGRGMERKTKRLRRQVKEIKKERQEGLLAGPEAATSNVMYVPIHENTTEAVSMELMHTC